MRLLLSFSLFFFNDTATTEIYTLSLHHALPISHALGRERSHLAHSELQRDELQVTHVVPQDAGGGAIRAGMRTLRADRKSTRLNSSHSQISYAVFCLKKKKKKTKTYYQ